MSDVIVRKAELGDEAAILRMIRGLATYEREPDAVKATEESLRAMLFEREAAHAFLAEQYGQAVGLALWFLNFSTWTGTQGLYLEDLFVDPAARKLGVGRRLMAACAREAQARGCARMDWSVLDWNESAMDFYRRLGARRMSGWQPWRLDGAGIAALAAD